MQPSDSPSTSTSPSSQPTTSPTTELENYVPNVSTLRNQIICGYQGWFAYPGDGAAINKWKHWFSSDNYPSAEHLEVDMYPYMDEYNNEDLKESNVLHRDGTKAKFFSSARPNVVKKHFEWMREYGISGVFHMRFMQDIDKPHNYEWKTKVLRNVRAAAEHSGRVFAVSYNISGNNLNNTVLDDIKTDWMGLVDNEQITQSGRYLHHNRLPVLRIYGIGFKSVKVSDTVKMANLIQWFKSEADPKYRVFLIGGVPSGWRNLTLDSREPIAWRGIYESLDGIHPWHVGRWGSIVGFETYYRNTIAKDAELCAELGILYMPTMWPGFSWHNLNRKARHANGSLRAIPLVPINSIPRLGGRFMWSQAYRYAENDNITSVWMAQFDEVDEGTAIFKVAKTKHELPAQGNWLTLDVDGDGEIPHDWYLRLCGHAQLMMLGKIEVMETMPINASDYCLECQGTNIVDH
ncbi:hypothetical protein HJC23_006047 [Cyclotella cryptica]|uniref:Xylosidase/arabinosidase n=1 Tax=Cyclotella cryptica TaxID=29204 RepID=A0ABD3PT99_9STRA